MIAGEFARDADFRRHVRPSFEFLESVHGLDFVRIDVTDKDPRDSTLVARYRGNLGRVHVAWNHYALSLGVLIRLERDELPRWARYLYLEPLVEFLTGGNEKSIVPQMYLGLEESEILELMDDRHRLCEDHTVAELLQLLAAKLSTHLSRIIRLTDDEILEYQRWWSSGGDGSRR